MLVHVGAEGLLRKLASLKRLDVQYSTQPDGNGGSFSGGSRRMASGSDFMNYSLFKDAALTQAWGTGIAGGTTSAYNAATKNVTAVTVFGMVPAAQDVTVGAYADVVVATINY